MNDIQTTVALLRANKFCILGTVSDVGQPWTTPVGYKIDPQCNFYWTSDNTTLHSRNIAINSAMSLCILDMTGTLPVKSPRGEHPRGLYASGKGRALPLEELGELLQWRYPGGPQQPEQFDPATRPASVYQFTPDKLWWLADPSSEPGGSSDQRQEIDLAALRAALSS